MAVALLAPVPLEYLREGVEIIQRKGRVAFGSRSWELFRDLDEMRQGLPVYVYLYASDGIRPTVVEASWVARYVGHVESQGGEHPAGRDFRPQATATDDTGHWAVFWEVVALRELPEAERIPINHFSGYRKGQPYKSSYVPRGPALVNHP